MCAPCAPTAEGPVGSSVASTGPSQLSLSSVGAISGLSGLATGYLCFQCKCKTGNCLLELKGSQLRAAYAVTHPNGEGTSPSTVNAKLHGLLWLMKKPLNRPNNRGHNWKIPSFQYDTIPLCKRGWEVLMGATGWGMRMSLSWVLRGVSPADLAAKCGAALLVAAETRVEAEASEKRRLTVDWLHHHYLSAMEFMPNENRIVLRGVGSMTVHKDMYQTNARKGGFYLSYKQFVACMRPAAAACAAAEHGV